MRLIRGHFHGTGADLYLQLGGIPSWFKMWGLEAATPCYIDWTPDMAADDLTTEGIYRDANGGALADLEYGEGIAPYYGGEVLTTVTQPSITYGAATVDYIERDDKDYRFLTDGDAGIWGDASDGDITTWTLDTAGTPTGHFNYDAVGTYINDGSLIRVVDDEKNHTYEAHIVNSAIDTDGSASDEIELSWAVPSGRIDFIGGWAGYKPTPRGALTKAGVKISEAVVNYESYMVAFFAIME